MAFAQTASEATDSQAVGLEDIVVTAQKRTENIQDVPIAISAFTAQALESRGIGSVSALAKLTPNVTLDSGSFAGGSASVLSAYVRGVGQSDFAINFDPGVGIYVDGIYLGRSIGANTSLFDVERIEILKGPQGTLFGRNSVGGAVNVVTRAPAKEFAFTGEVTTGRFNRFDVRGIVDIPITETLQGSLAFSKEGRDGYVKRVPFPDAAGFFQDPPFETNHNSKPDSEGGVNSWTVRGKLHWQASDAIDVMLEGDYSHVDTSNAPIALLKTVTATGLNSIVGACINNSVATLNAIGLGAICGPRAVIGTSLGGANVDANPENNRLPFDDRFLSPGRSKTYSTGNSYDKEKIYGAGATVNFNLGDNIDLKSISSYRKLNWDTAADLDGSPVDFVSIENQVRQRQFSQEFQLVGQALDERLSYVFGAYYFDEKATTNDFVPISQILLLEAPLRLRTKAAAAFTHLNFKVSDSFSLTFGARYTEERKSIDVGQRDVNALSYKLTPGCFPVTEACRVALGFPDANDPLRYAPDVTNKRKFTNFAPRIGFEYHADRDVMFYGSYAKGYKSGSWTTRLSAPVAVLPSFNPEKATSYELGVKSELLDRKLRINTAGFFTQYKDIQLNFQEGVSPVIRNAGDADIYGFEVEAQAAISAGLTLQAGLGYLHAKYQNVAANTGLTTGNKLPRTPKWKFIVGPQYEYELSNGGAIKVNVDYSHTSSLYNDTANTPELFRPSVDDLGVSLSYKAPEHWRLTVGATNLLNERYLITGQDNSSGGWINGTYSRPAEWYASIRVSF